MKCEQAMRLSSEYIDEALSARDMWEMDIHLKVCNRCASQINELRTTVAVLSESPRFEVSADFMSNLESRLQSVEIRPSRMGWLDRLMSIFRPRFVPAWGAALTVCGAFAFFVMTSVKSGRDAGESTRQEQQMNVDAHNHDIALNAVDPLGDLAAASVAANRVTQESRESSVN